MNVHIKINSNKNNLPLDTLFNMAARINKKRRFLFVSNVLGKHVPVRNSNSLLTGALLACEFVEEYYDICYPLKEKLIDSLVSSKNGNDVWKDIISHPVRPGESLLFLAFAETATALGHSVFSCFDNAHFIHTTREEIPDFKDRLVFEEEHSHATSHRVYPENLDLLRSDSPIILIDDEISTGKTVLNIIKELNEVHKRKEYVVLSILDFRSKADIDYLNEFQNTYGIKVKFISLVSGEFVADPVEGFRGWDKVDEFLSDPKSQSDEDIDNAFGNDRHSANKSQVAYISLDKFFTNKIEKSSINGLGECIKTAYILESGRFGLDSDANRKVIEKVARVAEHISKELTDKKILFLGTEEFMYIPLLISSFINKDIYYHSTTRSPIYPNISETYPVKNRFVFASPANRAVTNYVYNIPFGFYDEIFVFFERSFDKEGLDELLEVLKSRGAKEITVLSCSGSFI